MSSKAFHEDDDDILDRQGLVGIRRVVTAYSCNVGIHQLIARDQQHVAYGLLCLRLRQGRLPDIGPVLGHAVLGGGEQLQRAVKAQLVGEVRLSGVDIAPAHGRALAQGATGSDHADHQAHHEYRQPGIPGSDLAGPDVATAEWATRAGGTVGPLNARLSSQVPTAQANR